MSKDLQGWAGGLSPGLEGDSRRVGVPGNMEHYTWQWSGLLLRLQWLEFESQACQHLPGC